MEAYVYGGKEIYVQAFNAIAIMSGLDSVSSLIRLVLLIGLAMVLIQVAFTNKVKEILSWFLTATTILAVGFVPKSDVVIHDRIGGGAPTVVANVPLAVAFVFSVSSTAGDRMTSLMETVFGDPDIAKYSENGMIYGSRLMRELNQMRWIDEEYAQNMQSFLTNCVFYDLLEGDIELQDIRDSEDLFSLITVDHPPNPARSGPWLTDGAETIETCAYIAGELSSGADAARALSETYLARRLHPDDADAAARTLLSSEVAGAHTLLMNQARASSEVFIQAMMINSFRESVETFSAESGGELSGYGLARAELQTRNTNLFNAALAHKWIPYLKVVLEIMFFCMFPLLIPFMLLPGMGVSLIRSYFGGFIMLQSWGPLFVVLNKIMMVAAVSDTQAAAYDPTGGGDAGSITMFNLQSIADANSDIASIAGFMTMLIPVIASALALGVDRVASQSESLLSSVRAGASDAARDETTGNLSLGTTGYDTHRFNQTFGNQHQMNHSLEAGAASMNTASGGHIAITPDGREVYDNTGALSKTGTGAQFARAIGSQFERRASEAAQYAETWTESAAQSREEGASVLFSDRETVQSMAQSVLSEGSSATQEQRAAAAIVQRHNEHADQAYSQAVEEQAQLNYGVDGAITAGARASGGMELFGTGGAVFGEARVRGSAGWSEADRETIRSDYRESLSSDEQRELTDALATLNSFSTSAGYSESGGIQNSTARDAQQHFREAERFEESASRARSIQQQAQTAAAEYESGNLSFTQPLEDQFLQFVGTQRNDAGDIYSSQPFWQDEVTQMIVNGDRSPELQGLLQGFADAQLPHLPQIGDVSAFSVAGDDLVNYGQIDNAAARTGDVATRIGETAADLSTTNAGVGFNGEAMDAVQAGRDISGQVQDGIGGRSAEFDQPLFDGTPHMRDMRRANEEREDVADGMPKPDFTFLPDGMPGSPATNAIGQVGQMQNTQEIEADIAAMEGFATRFSEQN
ncbi:MULTISPECIES: conjugal transfer protein TraG N-terminal domain-containing protein [Alphaproteobacteria]|jgi:conjugal transfer mating pair stabilization protein TraG|uniref:Conjugal transfer protein TraG n=1 Tax=Maricaulis virginensis TaxID=144022 RepID=A0A9W6MPU4_9PROT|nr:conjugal transfer protein TraG N-terminal domain-containing protein [Maricaulis virginensis]GLK53547.1 conjugal transfer protein TraG [Maricaulis virginensis]